jgi:protein-tyrosine kinase
MHAVTPAVPSIVPQPPERPTLARMPSAVTIEKRFSGSPLEGKIVGTSTMDPSAVEQYVALATALRTIQVARSLRTIMVSSAVVGEGKTLTAVNLALVLSERLGRRVLLVDADFESPSIHEIFQVLNVSGLGDALASDNANVPVIAISKNLAVLPSGRMQPEPMAALLSQRMKALLLDAASNFDWIVLDTPPVTQISDPQLLGWLADGVVLVVEAGKTPTKAVQAAIEELGADRVIGVVLNRAPARSVQHA